MYPNFCFRKPPTDFGYDVMYMPKSCPHLHSHSHARPRSRARPTPSKMCCDELISLHALHDQNEQVRLSHGLKSQTRTPARTVEFRLPTMQQKRYRESAGIEPTECEYNEKQQQQMQHQQQQQQQQQHQHQQQHQMQQQQQQQQPASAPRELPSSAADTSREIQDSCTDFFNIIYENVLEAVHGAVEHMVSKHFEQMLCRIDQVAADLMDQAAAIKQLSTDVLGKLAEQNETSINQFKFIAQMLIDNQTIFYRALSSQRRQKHHSKEELPDRPDQKITSNAEREHSQRQESTARVQQHQLWQQQDDRIFLQPSFCKSCSHKSMKSDRADCSRPLAIVRRSAKGVSTASMPNLHHSSLFPATRTANSKCKGQHTQRTATPTPQSDGAGSLRKCRCLWPTGQERSPSPRRRLRTTGKALPSSDDVRSHR